MPNCPCHRFRTIQDIASAVIVDRKAVIVDEKKFQTQQVQLSDEIDAPTTVSLTTPVQDDDANVSSSSELNILSLLSWISQTLIKHDGGSQEISLTFCADPCPNRGQASLEILNAIRDACRPFLDESDDISVEVTPNADASSRSGPPTNAVRGAKPLNHHLSKTRYEESFPRLSSGQDQKGQLEHVRQQHRTPGATPNHRQNPKHQQPTAQYHQQRRNTNPSSKNNKRRIRPATIQTTQYNNAMSPWGTHQQLPAFSPASSPSLLYQMPSSSFSSSSSSSNIALHLLEQRFDKPQTNTVVRPKSSDGGTDEQSSLSKGELPLESKEEVNNRSEEISQEGELQQQHPPVMEDLKSLPSLENLVKLYNSLIEASLVPSTALELHLLLRLLTVSPQSSRNKDGSSESITNPTVFAPLFSDSGRCILFASQVLLRQAKTLFGLGLTRYLVSCPTVKAHSPDLIVQLLELEQEHESGSPISGPRSRFPSRSSANQTALFTLPFDPARDSKHKFRSPEEQALFKNRESVRDIFLLQLRNFHNEKSKLHIIGSSLKRTAAQDRQMVRTVMDGISSDNLAWFAEFFKDLLLQLGPVPVVQETDKDLLQIADSEILQKLHQRLFSASSTQNNKPSNKSSQSLVDPSNLRSSASRNSQSGVNGTSKGGASPSMSMEEEQLEFFPGYEEFFFIFMKAADSYQFNRHLLISFTENLKSATLDAFSLVSDNLDEVDGCMQRLRLLSKFVGVLLFSPFWLCTLTHPAVNKANHGHGDDVLGWLSYSKISLSEIIRKAKRERALVVMLPWIIDLLRMGRWVPNIAPMEDSPSTYETVLRELRTIQLALDDGTWSNQIISVTNKAYLRSCLESLFFGSIGLARTTTLKQDQGIKSSLEQSPEEGFDQLDGLITKETLLSADSPIGELFDLAGFLSRPTSKRIPGTSRKLRPLQLQLDKNLYNSPFSSQQQPENRNLTTDSSQGKHLIERKLRDTFFHQHGRLKEVCDFAINQTLKDLSGALHTECITPFINKKCEDIEAVDITSIEAELFSTGKHFVRSLLSGQVLETLKVLAPRNCKEEVRKLACVFAVEHGCERAVASIRPAVADATKILIDEKKKTGKPNLAAKETKYSGDDEQDTTENGMEQFEALVNLSVQMELLANNLTDDVDMQTTVATLLEASSALDLYVQKETSEIAPQALLRRVFESIVHVDSHLERHLRSWLCDNNEKHWELFVALFSFACSLTHLSRHGLPSLVQIVVDPHAAASLMNMAEVSGGMAVFIEVLVKFIQVKLVPFAAIVKSLPFLHIRDQVVLVGQRLAPEISWQTLAELHVDRGETSE
ncbi:hypothetical protein ACA910_001711 [Epithemia clementina (nom. ined.)]